MLLQKNGTYKFPIKVFNLQCKSEYVNNFGIHYYLANSIVVHNFICVATFL